MRFISITAAGLFSIISLSALGGPSTIQLKNIAEMETSSAGKTMSVPAKDVPPNGEVVYTSRFRNTSHEPVKNIVIINPIPQNTFYIGESAIGTNADITYSLDGKHYALPQDLEVKGAHGAGRKAIASDYTHIRWIYKAELQPGQAGEAIFRVKVR